MNTRPQRPPGNPPAGKPGAPGTQVATASPKLVDIFSARYGIEPSMMLSTLRGTAFKVKATEQPATNEELAGLLVVANEYHLNPFIREIYAYRAKSGAI